MAFRHATNTTVAICAGRVCALERTYQQGEGFVTERWTRFTDESAVWERRFGRYEVAEIPDEDVRWLFELCPANESDIRRRFPSAEVCFV